MQSPRIEQRGSFLIAGTVERYNNQTTDGIAKQWERFGPQIGRIPGQVGSTSYGVCFDFDGNGYFDYMCGVEVTAPAPGLGQLRIAPQKYAVFSHRDHISKIKGTWDAIFRDWAPSSGCTLLDAPQFEVYDENFTPESGVVEIWIPIE